MSLCKGCGTPLVDGVCSCHLLVGDLKAEIERLCTELEKLEAVNNALALRAAGAELQAEQLRAEVERLRKSFDEGIKEWADIGEAARKAKMVALLQNGDMKTALIELGMARAAWIHHCHAPEILKALWKVMEGDRACTHRVSEYGPGVSGPGETWTSPGVGAAGYSYCTCCGTRNPADSILNTPLKPKAEPLGDPPPGWNYHALGCRSRKLTPDGTSWVYKPYDCDCQPGDAAKPKQDAHQSVQFRTESQLPSNMDIARVWVDGSRLCIKMAIDNAFDVEFVDHVVFRPRSVAQGVGKPKCARCGGSELVEGVSCGFPVHLPCPSCVSDPPPIEKRVEQSQKCDHAPGVGPVLAPGRGLSTVCVKCGSILVQ